MALTYTLEGFDLHQPDIGFYLLEGTEFASAIAPRRVNIVLPNMHGEIPAWNDPISSTTIIVRVRIRGNSPEDMEQKWNYLRSLCRLGSNNPVTMRREGAVEITSAFVQLESMDRPDFHCAVDMVTTTMSFHNPSGRWQAVNPSTEQLNVPGTDQVVQFAADSSAPITDALVQVRGPLFSLSVRDNTNNTGFQWITAFESVAADQYLLVNCATYRAWILDEDSWEPGGTEVTHGLLTTGNGMLALVPQVGFTLGSNSSSVTVGTSGNNSNTRLLIRGRRTYS